MNGADTDRFAATPDPLNIPYRAFEAVAGYAATLPPMSVRTVSLALEAALPIAHAHELRQVAKTYHQRADQWRPLRSYEAVLRVRIYDELAAEHLARANALDPLPRGDAA